MLFVLIHDLMRWMNWDRWVGVGMIATALWVLIFWYAEGDEAKWNKSDGYHEWQGQDFWD
jgi:hypothetical protein